MSRSSSRRAARLLAGRPAVLGGAAWGGALGRVDLKRQGQQARERGGEAQRAGPGRVDREQEEP